MSRPLSNYFLGDEIEALYLDGVEVGEERIAASQE